MHSIYMTDLPALPRKALCLALAAAFACPAMAEEDDEVARLIQPESNISVGVGHVSGDNQRFGVYNGLNKEGTVGLGSFSVIRRDDDTGTWFRAQGRNLGLDTRELRIEHERQGSWGYFIDYSQLPRVTPYEVHTNLTGIGSTTQSYPAYTATNGSPTLPLANNEAITLRTEREMTKLGFNKVFSPELEFKVLFQNEEKKGNRLFGRGTGAAVSVQEFLAEPINSTTRQIDAILDYTGETLQLSGGYYGSFYNNHNSVLNVNGGASSFNGGVGATGVPFDNIALPPDNYAHQFHLAGGYQITNTTRASFKVAKSFAYQNDDFFGVRFYNTANNGVSANTSGRTDLGGRLDTTLVQLGLTSRPLPKLSIVANLRYEDRDDKTPVARYITNVTAANANGTNTTFSPLSAAANGTSTTDGFNEPRSLKNKSGKLEASYLLPQGFRLTGGVDVEQKDHNVSGVRIVGFRTQTQEDTYRLELKRAMAESLAGSLAYSHSERTGSDYRSLTTLGGYNYPTYGNNISCGASLPVGAVNVTRCGLIQPIYLADRNRDKWRLAVDWSPLDALSTQFAFEDSQDDYGSGRGNPDIGTRKGGARLYSVDMTYALNDNWKLSGWAAREESRIDQGTIAFGNNNTVSNANLTLWSANQKNTVDSYSVGIRGKLFSKLLDVGADYIYAHDLTTYRLGKDNAGTAAVGDLPDITYKQSTLKLFGKYAVRKDLSMRMDYVFDHRKADDWTWTGWSYSDGTQIVQRPEDKVHFIGVSMNYSFR